MRLPPRRSAVPTVDTYGTQPLTWHLNVLATPAFYPCPVSPLRVYTGHSSLSLDKRMTKMMGRCSHMMFIRRNAESHKQSHDRRSCPRTASTEEEKFQHRTGPACTQQEQVGVMTKEQYRGQGTGNDSEKTWRIRGILPKQVLGFFLKLGYAGQLHSPTPGHWEFRIAWPSSERGPCPCG